jgi:NitT/TauT family transport system substrate-binding protein/putative hydroxymethylpyrimidine transport system substrate-binding protein
VAAVPVFWNAEGVVLRERGVETNEFRVDDYGAPPYPEVVLIVTRQTLEQRPELVEGVVKAIADGTRTVLEDPEAAVREIAHAGGADLDLTRAQLEAVRPVLEPPLRLDRDVLEQWAEFDARFGILERRPDVDETFAFGLER